MYNDCWDAPLPTGKQAWQAQGLPHRPSCARHPQRIIIETDAELNEDKQNIQRNANYKRFIERRQFVDVLVMMFMRMCHARLRYLSILKTDKPAD